MRKYIKKLTSIFCVISMLFSNMSVNGTEEYEGNKHENIKESSNSHIKNNILCLIGLTILGTVIYKIKNKKTEENSTKPNNNINKNDKKININPKDNVNKVKREENWIKFLSGEKIDDKSFKFSSCEDFRQANNDDLEESHDYVQVVFPNFEKSSYANSDLYLNKNIEKWKKVLLNKETCVKIQENLNLNLIHMLKFWEFKIIVNKENNKITKLVASDNSAPFREYDHNRLRLTRVLISLKIFGLNNEYNLLMEAIKEKHTGKSSYKFWENTKNTLCLVS